MEETFRLFFYLRLGYAIIILGIVVGVVLWAVKNGQFKSQSRASNLPLEIDKNNSDNS